MASKARLGAPGVVDVEGHPGGEGAIDGDEVVVEPVVLVAAGAVVLVGAQEDVVHGADVRLHATGIQQTINKMALILCIGLIQDEHH